MRKKTIYVAMLLTLICAGFAGCVKDDGNYDYKDIAGFTARSVTVKINGKAVSVVGGNKIVINPNDLLNIVVEGELGTDFDPVYHWMLFEIDPPMRPGTDLEDYFEPAEEIAATKDFDGHFNKSPGNYTLYYVVENRKNDSRFYEEFTVEVESVKGMLVYHADAAGLADYSVVRTSEMGLGLPPEKLGMISNVYSSVNGGAKIANPTRVWLRRVNDPMFEDQIFLAHEGGMVQVNYRTHVKEHDSYNAYFMFPPEGTPDPQGYMNGSNKTEYLVQGGQVYGINYMTASRALFTPVSNYGTYSPCMMTIPQSINRDYRNIFYNMTSGGFEYDYWGAMAPFFSVPGSLGGEDVDIMNTGMNLVFMDMGNGSTIDAVMRDRSGAYRYVRFDVTNPYGAMCIENIDLSPFPADENSLWAVGNRGSAAFFSAGNELYILDMQDKTSHAAELGLPANDAISVVQVLKDSDENNATNNNAVIFIAYNSGGEGKLLQYKFNPSTGVLDKTSRQEFGGFGRILDIVLKK